MLEFVKKHADIFAVIGLIIFCILIFFVGIGTYPLMDVDETRYVLMSRDMFHSKDFMTLYLNGEYFFEKPPLYFWGEILSFFAFGHISEFTARFPVALYGTFSTLLLYFVGKKVVSRNYGIIAALILATSVEFLILAKYAILDIVLATCVEFSICSGFLTYFVKEENKKYFWWGFYIFSALAVLAKGIPGIALPFGTMFFVAIFTKRFKELFRPQYLLVGILLFLLIVLPWHIIMLIKHNPLFFQEYIIRHHWARFFDSSLGINRKQPWFYFILTFLWGFFPWILSSIGILVVKIKEKAKFPINFDKLDNVHKFLFLNFIAFVFTMLFFSSSSTKLVTYILPIYFAAANLIAWGWVQYLENKKYAKPIEYTSAAIFFLFVFLAVVALFTPLLPKEIYSYILPVKWFTISILFVFGAFGILSLKFNKNIGIFATFVAFFVVLSAFGIPKYFELDYSFGQNDLMKYGMYAKENNLKLHTINMGNRYSLNYYGPKDVIYITSEPQVLQAIINTTSDNSVFIIKTKKLKELEGYVRYNVLDQGAKYTLFSK